MGAKQSRSSLLPPERGERQEKTPESKSRAAFGLSWEEPWQPRKGLDAPSLQVFKARLDRALANMI